MIWTLKPNLYAEQVGPQLTEREKLPQIGLSDIIITEYKYKQGENAFYVEPAKNT